MENSRKNKTEEREHEAHWIYHSLFENAPILLQTQRQNFAGSAIL